MLPVYYTVCMIAAIINIINIINIILFTVAIIETSHCYN